MSSGDEVSNRFSFISFVFSVLGFFFFSVYGIGMYFGIIAVFVSFLAEDYFKEKSFWQYLAIIIAVIDIFGALVGWNIIIKTGV